MQEIWVAQLPAAAAPINLAFVPEFRESRNALGRSEVGTCRLLVPCVYSCEGSE